MNKNLLIIGAITFIAITGNVWAGGHYNWLEKENAEIQEDYSEAVSKINHSSFSQSQKDILMQQANDNKALALSQAQAKNDQLQKNREARKAFTDGDGYFADKKARKVFKEIDDIL